MINENRTIGIVATEFVMSDLVHLYCIILVIFVMNNIAFTVAQWIPLLSCSKKSIQFQFILFI